MAREFAREFYNTGAWKNCAKSYKKYRHGLCERCLTNGIYKPGVIVHHVVELTPENIMDPTVALNWENLQLLCREHHAEIHGAGELRYRIDEYGRVVCI